MKKAIWPFTLVATFLVCLGLVYYGLWLFGLDKANRMVLKGNTQEAPEYYESSLALFDKAPLLSQTLRQDYQDTVFNHVSLLYAQGKDDVILEILEREARRSPHITDAPSFSFWLGNVLLRRAAHSKDPEAMMTSLQEAATAYRKGLELHPDDWDLKYNYEMVQTILSQKGRGRGKQEKVKSVLKKMRQLKKPEEKELPPERRG